MSIILRRKCWLSVKISLTIHLIEKFIILFPNTYGKTLMFNQLYPFLNGPTITLSSQNLNFLFWVRRSQWWQLLQQDRRRHTSTVKHNGSCFFNWNKCQIHLRDTDFHIPLKSVYNCIYHLFRKNGMIFHNDDNDSAWITIHQCCWIPICCK